MTKLANINDLGATADALGDIRAEMAALKKTAKTYEDALLATGNDVVEGSKFRVAISYGVETAKVNWKKIATDLGATKQKITGNTSYGYSNKIRVSAMKK